MFLKQSKVTINGKSYSYYKIVESYRDKGKVKHKILFSLGALTDEQADKIRMAISAYSNPDVIVSKIDDIVVTKHFAYLDVCLLHELWHKWQFDKFFSYDRWIEAIVINRCIDPTSKIHVQEWVSDTILPALNSSDILDVNEFDIYRELDHIDNYEAKLQEFIYQELKQQSKFSDEALFYDITSSYFEGIKCVLAKFGYSRDHRPDKEQIAIALMITKEGYPFYWKVLEGNTQDITTVESLVDTIKNRFGIKSCTLVFDRGMVSADNLALIERKDLSYISALDKDEIKSTGILDISIPQPFLPASWDKDIVTCQFQSYDDKGSLYYREFDFGKYRYILFFDAERFLSDYKSRENRLKDFYTWVEAKNQELLKAKRSRSLSVLEEQVKHMLAKKQVKKLLEVKIEPLSLNIPDKKRVINTYQIKVSLNPEAKRQEQRLDGITCFITNLKMCSAKEVVRYYRDKNKVEEGFHEIKSQLNLRPIRLTRDQRVRAHVTACILSYFLLNDIEQRLKAKNIDLSTASVLKEFKKCQVSKIEIKGNNRSELKVTEPTQNQRSLLEALDCENVIEKKYIKKVLSKAKNQV
jgi:transposase